MPGLWLPDATGTLQPVKGLWVADPGGTYQQVTRALVADAGGTFQSAYQPGPAVTAAAAKTGNPAYTQALISWATASATRVQVLISGTSTVLWDTNDIAAVTQGSYAWPGAIPGQSYKFTVRAFAADGSYVDSAPQALTMAGVPAPASLRYSALAYNSVRMDWNAVAGASKYEVLNNLYGGGVLYSGPALGYTQALYASAKYDFTVRATVAGITGGQSNHIAFTSPATPGPAAGAYTFIATGATVWQPSYNSWRPESDGIIHGNGAAWGSPSGDQTTYFYYGNNPFSKLKGGTVKRMQIFLQRDSSSGSSAAQANHFGLHGYTGQPAGAPGFLGGIDVGALAWGQGIWFDLPTQWGQALVNGSAGGISWGGVDGRYMRGVGPKTSSMQGRIVLTI